MNAVNTDPLDTAYLAIGAARMLDKLPRARALHDAGELDIVQLAIDAAPALQAAWDELGGEWDGVWAYDVAEPVGRAVVMYAIGNDLDSSPAGYGRIVRAVIASAR